MIDDFKYEEDILRKSASGRMQAVTHISFTTVALFYIFIYKTKNGNFFLDIFYSFIE